MGIVTHALSFGAGYAAGMKIGDRPIQATKEMVTGAQSSSAAVASRAREMGSRVSERLPETLRRAVPTADVRQVRDVMTPSPTTIATSATVREAASTLEREEIGSVIAVEGEQVRGIVTDRDIALRVVAAGREPATTKVSEVMTATPAVIDPAASVHEAVDLMRQHDVRRLPVVEAGRAVGVVAIGDLSTSSDASGLLADISSAPPNN